MILTQYFIVMTNKTKKNIRLFPQVTSYLYNYVYKRVFTFFDRNFGFHCNIKHRVHNSTLKLFTFKYTFSFNCCLFVAQKFCCSYRYNRYLIIVDKQYFEIRRKEISVNPIHKRQCSSVKAQKWVRNYLEFFEIEQI